MIKRTIMSIAAISAASMMTFSVSAAEVDGPEVNWNLSVWGKERAFTSGIEAIRDYVAEKTD